LNVHVNYLRRELPAGHARLEKGTAFMLNLLDIKPLPLATAGLDPVKGEIKSTPEDFVVEEIPAYEPAGEGDFLYLWVEKRDFSSPYMARSLAKALSIPSMEVGMAGYKDRRSVSRQWISVPGHLEKETDKVEIEGFKILKKSRHGNKLRTGHLHGNQFNILLRSNMDEQNQQKIKKLVERVTETGLWNFYGEQRFGKNLETLKIGLDLLAQDKEASRRPFYLRKLALSAVQSALFNEVLRLRVTNNTHKKVLAGDILCMLPQESKCHARNLQEDQDRVDQGLMAVTGPMQGWKMYPKPTEEALLLETKVCESFGFKQEVWKGFGKFLMGARRCLVYPISELNLGFETDGVRLSFSLPAGAYATQLIREITQQDAAEEPEC